jgi:flagellar FliJ protein
MAVFKFKLNTLHRLKKQIEDQAKNRLGIAVAALDAENLKLNRIYAVIETAVGEFRRLSGGLFTAGKIKDYNYFLSAMREKAERQLLAVEGAKRVVSEARDALLAAARQRETFDRLREKSFQNYLEEEKRAEGLIVDEIVSYRGNAR